MRRSVSSIVWPPEEQRRPARQLVEVGPDADDLLAPDKIERPMTSASSCSAAETICSGV